MELVVSATQRGVWLLSSWRVFLCCPRNLGTWEASGPQVHPDLGLVFGPAHPVLRQPPCSSRGRAHCLLSEPLLLSICLTVTLETALGEEEQVVYVIRPEHLWGRRDWEVFLSARSICVSPFPVHHVLQPHRVCGCLESREELKPGPSAGLSLPVLLLAFFGQIA